MEFITELIWKMTIDNLFSISPSTDFSYSYLVFGFLLWLIIFSIIFEIVAKNQPDKFLKKAMRWSMWNIRWTFPAVWWLLLISRLEWIPFLNMKFLLIVYLLVFIVYAVFLFFWIKKEYFKRLKNQEKYSKK